MDIHLPGMSGIQVIQLIRAKAELRHIPIIALTALAMIDPQQSRVVELRYFGGLTIEETASAMNLSIATVKREWATARLWLKRALQADENVP